MAAEPCSPAHPCAERNSMHVMLWGECFFAEHEECYQRGAVITANDGDAVLTFPCGISMRVLGHRLDFYPEEIGAHHRNGVTAELLRKQRTPILEFANRVADYVETANSYDAWDKRRCAVEAVRVACEEARDDMLKAIERQMPAMGSDPPAGYPPGDPHGSAAAKRRMEAALKPFGWTCGPEFWQRYYVDPWVFNLANALERLSADRDRLVALERAGRG